MKRSPRGFGPWTTSLDNNSRLGLTTFWRRRMQAIAALPLTPHRVARRALAGAVVAAALLAATPLIDFAPAAVAQEDSPAVDAADAATAPPRNENFVVRFTNGVELELIGVSKSPSNADSWRAPDGTPIPAPYKSLRPQDNIWEAPMLREVCWRWHGADDPDIHTSWDVEENTSGWGPLQPAGPNGNLLKDLTAYVVPFTLIHPTCTLRFTVSYPGSKWQTYWQGQGGHVMANISTPPGKEPTGITLDKPRAMDGGAFVVMGYKLAQDQDARLIAVDGAGKRHVGKAEHAGGMMGIRQLAVHFPDLRPQDIRAWIVEQRTRLTETVEFRNVSLDPETQMIVQIIGRVAESSDNGAGSDQPSEPIDPRDAIVEFGPVVERIVRIKDPAHELLDLETGELYRAADVVTDNRPQWLVDHGIDAAGHIAPQFLGLWGFDLIAVSTDHENWEVPQELSDYLASARPGLDAKIDGSGPLPATFFFQTREGARGVLQIVEVITDEAVKIRYKLAK